MRVFITLPFVIFALSGCTGGPDPDCEGTECPPVCDDCTDGMARASVQPTFEGADVDCDVALGSNPGTSGEVFNLDPGTYPIKIGGDPQTYDGIDTHELDADTVLCAVPGDLTLAEGDDLTGTSAYEVALNRYLHIEDGYCVNTDGPGDDFYFGFAYLEGCSNLVGFEEELGSESWMTMEGGQLVLSGWLVDVLEVSMTYSYVTHKSFDYTTEKEGRPPSSYHCYDLEDPS